MITLKVDSKEETLIDVHDLPSCTLAIIESAKWPTIDTSHWLGRIVIRSGNRIVCLNTSQYWELSEKNNWSIKVRKLRPEETVTLNNNE